VVSYLGASQCQMPSRVDEIKEGGEGGKSAGEAFQNPKIQL